MALDPYPGDVRRGTDDGAEGRAAEPPRVGRPYDRSRDAQILALTLDALAERGYEQVTLDWVASRSGRAKTTLYRRWPTKAELMLAAIGAVGRPPEVETLPDEGALRADLLAVIDSPWLGGPDRRLAIFAGLTSAGRSSAPLAEAIHTQITVPYVAVYEALLHRAVERGQLPVHASGKVPLLAQVIPAMSSHRLGASRQPVDRTFYVSVVDQILLPALLA